MRLNSDQAASVAHDGHLLVVACPGSGKTRVLVERAARLRRDFPTDPILIATFTRQAANEVRERLTATLPSLADMRVATFHSFALQQILSAGTVRLCSPADQIALMRRAWLEVCTSCSLTSFCQAVEALTSGASAGLTEVEHAAAYDRYLELLLQHSAIDFSQAILRSVSGMASGSLAPLPCRHILVDEVQDIDSTQLQWLHAHIEAGATLTSVGDDDQAIYGWRHSLGFEGMSLICRRYRAEIITLSTNYRSHREILSWADRLIAHNEHRIPKSLTSSRGPGGAVYLHDQCWTDLEEAQLVARYAEEARDGFAVIARTNLKLDAVASELTHRQIPFTRHGQGSFWESEDPSLFLALLSPSGLSDPLTMSALTMRVGKVPGGREPGQIRKLRRELAALIRDPDPTDAINMVADFLHIHNAGLNPNRIEGADRAVDACRLSLLKMSGPLRERIAKAKRPPRTRAERVVLLTMHASKGLEFPTVWIIGCEASTLPHPKCPDIEEERRLMYVAMTRAERALHISFPRRKLRTRKTKRQTQETYLQRLDPSPFLSNDLGIEVAPMESGPAF